PPMTAGKAIHEALERDAEPGAICHGGYAVTVTGADSPLPGDRTIVAREAWLRREWDVPAHEAVVEMNMRRDALLDPPAVLDYKCSTKPANSYWLRQDSQWRIYCVTAGVDAFVYRFFRFRVETPIASDQAPHVFTDAPVDHELENNWTEDHIIELCAIAIATCKVLNVEDAIRSKPASRGQLKYLTRLVVEKRDLAEDIGLELSSAQMRQLTTYQAGSYIDRLVGVG
ncbi:MAG: hypothetical protein OXH75_07745, partial [Acidobacteria bacterium]|nr:hypothetical protein [Acidobacteriota bacterium]